MTRLKNGGFYNIRFFVTPQEFGSILSELEQKQAAFTLTNHEQTRHDYEQVYEQYETFYRYFTGAEKDEAYFPHFVYAISLRMDVESSGFFIRNEAISFPYVGQWAEDELPSIMLSFPKGHQIRLEDEKGQYVVYEDIREHRPLTYAFYDEVADHIKKITKPLRFSVMAFESSEAWKQEKPSARISKQAAQELAKSWVFTKYNLVMNTK